MPVQLQIPLGSLCDSFMNISMSVHMSVRTCLCTCVCTSPCTCLYTCLYTCTCMNTHVDIHMCVHMATYMSADISAHMSIYTPGHAYANVCTRVHTWPNGASLHMPVYTWLYTCRPPRNIIAWLRMVAAVSMCSIIVINLMITHVIFLLFVIEHWPPFPRVQSSVCAV